MRTELGALTRLRGSVVRGRKADFSTPPLTKTVSGFGRNDVFSVVEKEECRLRR
jgi:hypothetical protein